MSDTPYAEPAPQPEAIDEDVLRKRLVNRIAIAGVVIVALLGGLALIDTLYVAPATPTPTPKVPVPQPVVMNEVHDTAIAVSATAAPEPPKPEAVPTIKSHAEAEETSAPTVPFAVEKKPKEKLSAVRSAASKSEPPPVRPPISRPVTEGKSPPAKPEFLLQMGVFKDVGNAQELLARIQKAGVPAQIEARVQVGPFKTRQEADEARAKLTAAGLDAGLLIPKQH